MGSISYFLVGLVLFFGAHMFAAVRSRAPDGLAQRIGRGPYMGLFSLISLAGLVMLIIGYGGFRNTIPVWDPPVWTRHIPLTLMLPSLILLVAAYAPAGYIKKYSKHPMLAAVKIWAFAHLCANGDLASVILFGAFLTYGVIDRILVKGRGDPMAGKTPSPMGDAIAIVGGAIAYAAIAFWAHEALIGVPVMPV